MHNIKRLCFFVSFIITLHVHLCQAASIDTSFKFSTIETEHFLVHFHQGLDDLARKTVVIAEEIHSPLVKEFHWDPQEKTQIVLIDDADFTNGSATVLPYNTIYLQVVPPSIDMTIGEYEDWLRMLIVHEYSHILTMDAARGYSKVMRKIFGKPLPGSDPFSFLAFIATAPPNVFLPSWWHEGMATWGESEYTAVGRGKSTFYEMILRMAVAENNIPSVDQINGEIPYWPDGHMPYIFGMRLQKYISDKYGKDALGRLSFKHSGRAPYFISGAAQEVLGKDYAAIYREMIDDLKREELKRLEILKQIPFTPLKTFDLEGQTLTSPRYSPDGSSIAFNMSDPHGHEKIMISGRDGKGAREAVRRLPSDRTISWSPDGGRIYFSQAEIYRGFDIYQDLYSYDLKKGRLKRLTHGLRIKEPDVSLQEKRLAVIVNEKGNQNLAVLEFGGDGYRVNPLTDYRQFRLSNPRWSPENNHIVYSLKDNNGKSSIRIYNVNEKKETVLFENYNNNVYPAWSPDGRYIIYSSDETGVFNIFAYDIEGGRRYQITHVQGGLFQADISPDSKEMVFSSYDSRGFKILNIEYDHEKWMTEVSPSVKPYWNEANDRQPTNGSRQSDADRPYSVANETRPYSAMDTLLPRFWLPTLSGDHEGAAIGAFTAGQDVLGYNTYIAQVDLGAESGRVYYDVSYLNDYFYPTFAVQSYARPVQYTDLLSEDDYFELNKSLILSMTVPVNRLESNYRFTIGYQIQHQEELKKPSSNTLNGLSLFEGNRDNVFFGVDFFNALKYPYSISHEEGRKISLLYKYYSRDVGSDLDSREYAASYSEYFSLASNELRHHVIFLSLSGAASYGDRTLQQAFQLGGYPPETPYPLRGYPSRFATGQYITTGTLEYRAPVKYIFRGPGTKPFFIDRLHGAVFVDAGEVWDDNSGFTSDKLKVGAGIEARLDMTLGYWLRITPAIGIAQGFNEGGESTLYFILYTNL